MPSRDEQGKRIGGAAQARKKQQQAREEEAQQKKRTRHEKQSGLTFDSIPPPDLDDSASALTWWNRALLVCAYQVLRDPVMPFEQKIRYLHDGAAKAGMIRDKVAEQEHIKKILAKCSEKKTAGILEDVSQLAAPAISSPPR